MILIYYILWGLKVSATSDPRPDSYAHLWIFLAPSSKGTNRHTDTDTDIATYNPTGPEACWVKMGQTVLRTSARMSDLKPGESDKFPFGAASPNIGMQMQDCLVMPPPWWLLSPSHIWRDPVPHCQGSTGTTSPWKGTLYAITKKGIFEEKNS